MLKESLLFLVSYSSVSRRQNIASLTGAETPAINPLLKIRFSTEEMLEVFRSFSDDFLEKCSFYL
jgi:hypothetical protein